MPSIFATSVHPSNISEYKHADIITFIIVDCRNSNVMDPNGDRKKGCLNAWLIFAGILLTIITLTAMIMSIYLLIIMTTTSTTTETTATTTASKPAFAFLFVYTRRTTQIHFF